MSQAPLQQQYIVFNLHFESILLSCLEMSQKIWDALRDLGQFVQFKKC